MVYKVTDAKTVEHLFAGWQETTIWSALQGIMGDIYAVAQEFQRPHAAMVIMGDFCFLAGEPSAELVAYKPEKCPKDFIIMVPQNEAWAKVIEEHYQEKAGKVIRYAIRKDRGNFKKEKLTEAVAHLPEGCELRLIDRGLYEKCLAEEWSKDFVANYRDYEMFEKLGLGVVMVRKGTSLNGTEGTDSETNVTEEILAGASSYSTYQGGIEIEIVTREDCRRQGLAYMCASKLILECLERNLYPSWDARTRISVALAEKLGYEYSHEYVAYDIVGY